jgi:16S rRNA A1518/A1519 N6-dimethyltransferase RsmA/KsgA/DIM1 with predicted DNA glycosylase/AP lyase activity
VHQIFSFRRKTIRKAMAMSDLPVTALEKAGYDGQRRPESFAPVELLVLYKSLTGSPPTSSV